MIGKTLTTAFLLSVVTTVVQEAQTPLSYKPYLLAQEAQTPLIYERYPLAQIADEMLDPATEPPASTVSRHGEVEYLTHNVFGLHGYVEADDAVWHFVTAGDPNDEAILFVHGHPDTWEYWRTAEMVPKGEVPIVDANHFIQAEDLAIVADAARDLFD